MRWRIRETNGAWQVLRPDGSQLGDTHPSYQAALQALPGRAAMAELAPEDTPMPEEEPPAPEGDATPPGEPPPASAPVEEQPGPRSWTSDAAFVGQWTGDGRLIEAAGVTFRPFPLPLMFQDETDVGHFGAELAGWISGASIDGDRIRMHGEFYGEDGGEAAMRALDGPGEFGVSVDMGACSVESECVAMDDDGWCSEWRDRFTESEIIGLTMTPFPAFTNARLWLTLAGEPPALPTPAGAADDRPAITPDDQGGPGIEILLASAFPARPPADWFADPGVGAIDHELMTFNADGCPMGVPLQISDDGRIFGHLAAWGTCHVGRQDACVTAPGSPSQYAYFRTGYVVADDGGQVPTGVITMGTGHADLHLSAREATAHYDDATFGVADVAAGEDEVGIWIAGALRPTATDDQVRALRALSLSGDWRSIGGHLELVAALAVNVPGFPIPRSLAASARVADALTGPRARRTGDSVTVALVASGVVPRRERSGQQDRRLALIEERLDVLDARTRPLLASARQAIIDRRAR